MAKIIAICNQKGGVGKTTTAINLSTYLAVSGKQVLLIDIDPQGNATSGIGIDKSVVVVSSYNILLEQASLAQVALKTQVDRLSIIPSNINLTGAEIELVGAIGREYRLKKALSDGKEAYDFIIIDCPPSLGLLTINALSASNSVLIPIQCEYYALEGLGQLIQTINLVKENLNAELEIEGVLLTMADLRTRLTNEVIEEVKKYFFAQNQALGTSKLGVYEVVIPRNIKLSEAPGFGKPVYLYDRNSAGAQKYQEFTNELLGQKKEVIAP